MIQPSGDEVIGLSAADAAAVDAWVAARATGSPSTGPVASLLGLLDVRETEEPGAAQDLITVTLARVLRERERTTPGEVALSPADEEAFEALIQAEFHLDAVPPVLRSRAERVWRLRSLVCTPHDDHAAGAPALIDATLARIGDSTDRIPLSRRRPGFNFRIAELVSVAAMLLIGAGVLVPVATAARDSARQTVCSTNMAMVGSAFGLYANANRDQLPVAAASLGGGRWWEVGSSEGRSNSANLFTLARQGFAKIEQLACPGNPGACRSITVPDARDWTCLSEVSYSYQIMFGPQKPVWNGPDRVAVLADRSPVVLRAAEGQPIDPWENSPNHRKRGQKVLFSDGSAIFTRTPELDNRDNIWLPASIERAIGQFLGRAPRLEGREFPSDARDAFLGP